MSHFTTYRTVALPSAGERVGNRILSPTNRMERFFSRHILMAWLVCFVGMPTSLLAGVALFTTVAVLPLAFLMGWS